MADTLLTDDRGVSRGLHPGQIKILPIADRVTIAYSGLVVPALDLIRSARTELRAGVSLSDIIATLTRATRHDHCEFIVCAHTPDALLVKLRQGRLAKGSDRFALGDTTPLKRLPPISKYDPTASQPEHIRFQLQVLQLFHDEGHKLSSTVGGFW